MPPFSAAPRRTGVQLSSQLIDFRGKPKSATIIISAAATDVLDGVLARRSGEATPFGAVLDGVLDKSFAALVIGSLIWHNRLSFVEACLLGARELGELPLVIWWALHRAQSQARADHPRANWLGKLATVLQYAAILTVLSGNPLKGLLIWMTACAGIVTAALYWRRELIAPP